MFQSTLNTNAQDLASHSLFSVFSINMGFMAVFEAASEKNSEEIFDVKQIIQFPNEDRTGARDEKIGMICVLLVLLGSLLLLFGMYISSILKDRRNERNPPEDMDQRIADYLLNHENHRSVYFIQNVPPPTYDTLSPPPPTYQEAILVELYRT